MPRMRRPARLLRPVLIGATFAGLSFAVRESWGTGAGLWFVGALLAGWLALWLVTRHLEKKLRERGQALPAPDPNDG
jgi:hypothetical protein